MEFLAPKTGFFCKACNRFFSGAKEAEIAHCKTQKHYDNVKVSTIHACCGTNIGYVAKRDTIVFKPHHCSFMNTLRSVCTQN